MNEGALAANEAFYKAFNVKDFDAMSVVWADAPEVSCIHPGWNVLEGREAVLESWERILSNQDQPRIVFGGASAAVLGVVAVITCRELVAGAPLAATNVFVSQDGEWKMVHHHSGAVYQ